LDSPEQNINFANEDLAGAEIATTTDGSSIFGQIFGQVQSGPSPSLAKSL
jgi:hypothetical protein